MLQESKIDVNSFSNEKFKVNNRQSELNLNGLQENEVLMSQGENTLESKFWMTQQVHKDMEGKEPTITQLVDDYNEQQMMSKEQHKFKNSKKLNQKARKMPNLPNQSSENE